MIRNLLFVIFSYSMVITLFYYILLGLTYITSNEKLSLIIVLMLAIGTEISYDEQEQ